MIDDILIIINNSTEVLGLRKRIICIFAVAALLFSFSFTSAAESRDGTITVDTVNGVAGDSVIVNISIKDNPGIMAITVSVTYDSSVLTFEGFNKGVLKDYTVIPHPENNLIRFVCCENGDNNKNGVLLGLKFKIGEDLKGLSPITVEYSSGDFCNWELKHLMPDIISGGVEVKSAETDCKHSKYSSWVRTAEPDCTNSGYYSRSCENCGHTELKEIPALGHSFENKWTIDIAATDTENGTMSRHCIRCDEVTDVISFTKADAKENDFVNTLDETVEPNDFTGKPADNNSGKKDNTTNSGIDMPIKDGISIKKVLIAIMVFNFIIAFLHII